MSMTPARPDARPQSVPAKVSRERIVRLDVEADHCPQVLLRVLGLFAQRSIVPFTIAALRGDGDLALSVEIEAPPPEQAEALVARIESIVMVRSAKMTPCTATVAAQSLDTGSPSTHYLVPHSLGG